MHRRPVDISFHRVRTAKFHDMAVFLKECSALQIELWRQFNREGQLGVVLNVCRAHVWE